MGMYMLCPWWVYTCGSNGEQVSLSTKVDLACASSPLPALSACLGLPPGSSLSFSPHTQELHPYQQLDHKGVKATGGQFIHISLMTTRLIWEKKNDLECTKMGKSPMFPQQASCLASFLQTTEIQLLSLRICQLSADLPRPTPHPRTRRGEKRLAITQCSVAHCFCPLFAESVAQW